jgi:hypothetical protein
MAVTYDQLNIPGLNIEPPGKDPSIFDRLLQNTSNLLGAIPEQYQQLKSNVSPELAGGVSRAARYGPGALYGLQQFGQGNTPGAVGALATTALAGKMANNLLPNTPLGLIGKLGIGLASGPIGAQLGQGVAALGNQLVGGGQAAVQGAVNAIAGTQREAGQSGLTGKEVGLGGMSDQEYARQVALRKMGLMQIYKD